jgi:hypothetical protein
MSSNPSRTPSPAAETITTTEREAPTSSLVDSLLVAPEVQQTFGLVEGREGAQLRVRVGPDLLHAIRAKSCLVEPARGDTVLVARSEHHGCYALAVLVSPEHGTGATIAVDGDLTLRSNQGKVAISAPTVTVVAEKSASLHAPELLATSQKVTLFAGALSYVGQTIDAQVERVRHVGKSLEQVIGRVSSRVKYSQREIEEVERVKANELHVQAESTLNMHGKNTLMTAEKLVKLDGEQIHVG